MNFETLSSKENSSVNFVNRISKKEAIECRFVQHSDDYFIIYLSSMTGCDKACRMCHLTQTNQNHSRNLTYEEIILQLDRVLNYVKEKGLHANKVHVNFMARGEPLSNPVINKWLLDDIDTMLYDWNQDVHTKIKISSILPTDSSLKQIFYTTNSYDLELYYSLYSVKEDFRKKWLPKSHPPIIAFNLLKEFIELTGNRVVLHYAVIDGENDSEEDQVKILEMIERYSLKCDLNIVRYNPADNKYEESKNFEAYVRFMLTHFPGRVKVVPRMGYDIKTSCGCFV